MVKKFAENVRTDTLEEEEEEEDYKTKEMEIKELIPVPM